MNINYLIVCPKSNLLTEWAAGLDTLLPPAGTMHSTRPAPPYRPSCCPELVEGQAREAKMPIETKFNQSSLILRLQLPGRQDHFSFITIANLRYFIRSVCC